MDPAMIKQLRMALTKVGTTEKRPVTAAVTTPAAHQPPKKLVSALQALREQVEAAPMRFAQSSTQLMNNKGTKRKAPSAPSAPAKRLKSMAEAEKEAIETITTMIGNLKRNRHTCLFLMPFQLTSIREICAMEFHPDDDSEVVKLTDILRSELAKTDAAQSHPHFGCTDLKPGHWD
jgi:hypothetical protein